MRNFLADALVIPPGAFRLLLAFLVFVSHVSRVNTGRLGVILFFVLSGYWITRIWREQYKETSVGWFYLGRYLRLMPVYLAIVFCAWLIFGGSIWPNLRLFGIATTGGDVLGVSWSLDIELQFYVLLPLLLMTVATINRRIVALSVVGGAFGWYLFFAFGFSSVLQYLPAFAIGAIIYETKWYPDTRAGIVSLGVFFLITFAILISPLGWIFDKRVANDWQSDLFAFVWLIPLIPYVAASLKRKSNSLDRHLGNFTYPFYLVHFSVIQFVSTAVALTMGTKVAAMVLAIAVAALFYFLVDRPSEKLRYSLIAKKRQKVRNEEAAARSALP
ncbi:hypothetical protein CP97_10420 [Aurantiacibacter atlanticus]|uniref:Acyltransferase 3 domain-containing protein n=1 Tax=Aurantiacibacter atlanticus TaxID=1648404 RepID=A0A0H4VCF2_9SPHN|nr:acyltransferase [Aurantiacibacter atlanticus]AKQ42352.1 hypothetical protein CP97_10420 [Aurantiacibacter atlanticus]